MGWRSEARRAARRAGISDPEVFVRQMGQEAHGQDLTSPAGAQGPAQIMPATAAGWGLSPSQVHNRRAAYDAAAQHMAAYERQYGTRGALIAYNAGPGAVRSGSLPAETRNYISTILGGSRGVGPGGSGGATRTATGGTPASVSISQQTIFDRAGFEQARKRSIVANLLTQQGQAKNNPLFQTGLLSTTAPTRADFTDTRLRSKLTSATGDGGMVDDGPSTGAVSAAIRAARKRLGISEVNGSNRGAQVDQMEKRFAMIGQPWCGIFVGTVLQAAGVRGVDSRIASVSAIEAMARSRQGPFAGWVSAGQARAGDALVTSKGNHVVFVTGRSGNIIHTIGGNTGNGTVARVDYRADQVYGAARVRYRR
jgi:hypothetical protein